MKRTPVKTWFKYLFYASLVFLVIALVRADYLVIPVIRDYLSLGISLVLLPAGFLLSGISWAMVVRQGGYTIRLREGIESTGLAIFGKYIPGKLWVIMGRSEYLAGRHGWSRKNMATLSFDAQFLALWVALLLGTAGMIAIGGVNVYGLSVLILFLLLSGVIFTPLFHRVAEFFLGKLLRRPVTIPKLPLAKVWKPAAWYLLNWGTWCVSFYFLADSLVEGGVPFVSGFSFGLAASVGILAVFAPGGLGVREGILTGFFTLAGLAVPVATTIAVTSRLWFLTGEVFIFLTAFVISRTTPRTPRKQDHPASTG
mgnify:FL=1